jgi:FemAB-related protein (PEP-CTERM system-associated)
MNVRLSTDSDKEQWDTFVAQKGSGNFSLVYDWRKIFKEAYGLTSYYFGYWRGTELHGIFPLVKIKRKPFINRLISLPYLNHGGLYADHPQFQEELLQEAKRLLRDENLKSIELRQLMPLFEGPPPLPSYWTLQLSLQETEEKQWETLSAKVRNLVRKGKNKGLILHRGSEYLNTFYQIYAAKMRDLGTPVHSQLWFATILATFPQQVEILVVFATDQPIAGMFLFKYQGGLWDMWASSLKKYHHLVPNMFLYWEAIRYGVKNNFQYLDFGRSQYNDRTFQFKKQWGATPKPLFYTNVNSLGSLLLQEPKKQYAHLARLWQKLPLSLTLRIGPFVRPLLP